YAGVGDQGSAHAVVAAAATGGAACAAAAPARPVASRASVVTAATTWGRAPETRGDRIRGVRDNRMGYLVLLGMVLRTTPGGVASEGARPVRPRASTAERGPPRRRARGGAPRRGRSGHGAGARGPRRLVGGEPR